jgi:hypothetical protein
LKIGLLELSERGIPTIVRMQPFVKNWWRSMGTFFDLLCGAGCLGVVVEHLKKGKGQWTRLEEACNSLGTPLALLCSQKEGSDSILPIMDRIKNYKTVSTLAHNAGLVCFAADNALRPLGDSPYCCGQELILDFDPMLVQENFTSIGWKNRKVDYNFPFPYAVLPCKESTRIELRQDSKGVLQLAKMSWGQVMESWGKAGSNLRMLFPFSKRTLEGREQTEEWFSFCLSTRKPEMIAEARARVI